MSFLPSYVVPFLMQIFQDMFFCLTYYCLRKPWKKGHGDFQKKPKVNCYIELCNPFSWISSLFPWISNSFPRIRQLVLSDCNSFTQTGQLNSRELIALIGQLNLREWSVLIEGMYCNRRERVVQFKRTTNLGNELLIRENGLHNSI